MVERLVVYLNHESRLPKTSELNVVEIEDQRQPDSILYLDQFHLILPLD